MVNLDLQEGEKIIQQQPIIPSGPFRVLKPILVGSSAPVGVAQSETIMKWYAQLDHYFHPCQIEEGAPKPLQIQEQPDNQLTQELPPSSIKPAPPFESHLKNVWCTSVSSKREGRI